MKTPKDTPIIKFTAKLVVINSWTILRLPEEASLKLPSRGQVMVEGIINGFNIRTPLEPDGKWSHWFKVEQNVLKAINAKAGDTVTLEIKSTQNWPEPELPADVKSALKASPKARETWNKATPMAHWEWVRSIRSTNNPQTRERRIEVACSKLESGERRPCCWNRNLCTEPNIKF